MRSTEENSVKAAPGVPFFTPAGTALSPETAPVLFRPVKMRGMTLQNRFVVSPMCQYSADDGHLTDWHLAHLSQFAIRGNALTIVEATAVLPNGRITPQDSGLWKDSQKAPMQRVVDLVHSQGQKMGIQLAHAGRKASTVPTWVAQKMGVTAAVASPEQGGWPGNVWGPSAIKFAEGYPEPSEMTPDDIKSVVQAFKDAAARAVDVGFDMLEIHGAHGYLISEFLSPISNQRTDAYGGSFENRARLLFDVIASVRDVMPDSMPLFVRVSATEWMEWSNQPSWTIEETIKLAKLMPAARVDLLDVSSGGNNAQQSIEMHTHYQIDLAAKIRAELKKDGLALLIGAVGSVTEPEMARDIVEGGDDAKADLVFVGRQLLREPEFPLRVAHQLGVDVSWPNQYHRALWQRGQKVYP